MRVGSLSSAPRAVMRPSVVDRFCCRLVVVLTCGTGGAGSGVGVFREDSPPRDLGRRMVDARRTLLGAVKLAAPSMGAVWGVMGAGDMGVGGTLPWTRESNCFLAGEMAILARDSFMEMERSRRWAVGCFLMIGEAALVDEFS